MDQAFAELLKAGILGTVIVLLVTASIAGVIIWGPSFKAITALYDARILSLEARLNEAMAGWRAQTEATNKVAGAVEARNELDKARALDARQDRRARP